MVESHLDDFLDVIVVERVPYLLSLASAAHQLVRAQDAQLVLCSMPSSSAMLSTFFSSSDSAYMMRSRVESPNTLNKSASSKSTSDSGVCFSIYLTS